jgi:hypothetical protein
MKKDIDVVPAEIAPGMIEEYLRHLGYSGQDQVFIHRKGKHIEVGGVAFRCVK